MSCGQWDGLWVVGRGVRSGMRHRMRDRMGWNTGCRIWGLRLLGLRLLGLRLLGLRLLGLPANFPLSRHTR